MLIIKKTQNKQRSNLENIVLSIYDNADGDISRFHTGNILHSLTKQLA